MSYLKLHLKAIRMYFALPDCEPYSSDYRSASHPTQSAIAGLVGCAMGFARNSAESIKLRDTLNVYYHTLKPGLCIYKEIQTIRPLAIKTYAVHGKRGNNFETVGNGVPIEETNVCKTIDYLENAEFDVYIEGSEQELRQYHAALRNPRWITYAGKANCWFDEPLVPKECIIEEELPSCMQPC